MQLGLRASLYTKVELLTVRDNLLNYRLYLVHLDRIYYVVLALVIVLLGCLLKATPCLLNTVIKNIWETQQYRGSNITQSQLVHHLTQVNLSVVLTRCDVDIALIVDAKIGSAPTVYVIKLLRILYRPFLHMPSISFILSTLIFIFS